MGRLIGWKLSLHGVDPLGRTMVRSTGGDFAEPGEMTSVRNVSGHRDNQQTSCPGTRLYEQVPTIRSAAALHVPVFGHVVPTYALDEVSFEGWAIDRHADGGCARRGDRRRRRAEQDPRRQRGQRPRVAVPGGRLAAWLRGVRADRSRHRIHRRARH
ncbi:MAG: hypothetical protein R2695_03335 [Acidimicrobiales bacterium]